MDSSYYLKEKQQSRQAGNLSSCEDKEDGEAERKPCRLS